MGNKFWMNSPYTSVRLHKIMFSLYIYFSSNCCQLLLKLRSYHRYRWACLYYFNFVLICCMALQSKMITRQLRRPEMSKHGDDSSVRNWEFNRDLAAHFCRRTSNRSLAYTTNEIKLMPSFCMKQWPIRLQSFRRHC